MNIRCYPNKENVANPYVPNDVFIVADCEYMSGEVHITWYIDKNGVIWNRSDWVSDVAHNGSMHNLYKLTGDTEHMIMFRFQQWKRKG